MRQQHHSTIAYANTNLTQQERVETGLKRRFYRLNTDVGTYARGNIDSRGQTANSRASPWLPTRSLIRAKIPMIYGTIGFGKWGKRKRTTRGSVLPLTHGGDGSYRRESKPERTIVVCSVLEPEGATFCS